MSSFVLKKSKTIEVKDESGAVLKEFALSVGNYDNLKVWQSKIGDLEEIQSRLKQGVDVIEDLVKLEREIVTMTVGEWEWLWEATGKDVYMILGFIKHLQKHIAEEIDGYTKAYL